MISSAGRIASFGMSAPRALFSRPWSALVYAPSMCGKTTLILDLLSKLENFDPSPTHISCFGNINLQQFEVLIDLYGSDFVDINPVSKLPGFNFVPGSVVFVDEFNNALLSLKRKDQAGLIAAAKNLLNEGCHHFDLFSIISVQDMLRNDCYQFTRIAQSLILGTKNGHSIDVVRQMRILSPTMKEKIISVINMWSDISTFILVFHVPSIRDYFAYHYIWSHLTNLPDFAIAMRLQSNAKLPSVHPSAEIRLSMAGQQALREVLESPVPPELEGKMYAFVPFQSVRLDAEAEEPPKAAEEDSSLDKVDQNMMKMFSYCCSAKDLSTYRRFWYFLRAIPTISINEEGTVLFLEGRKISTLTFIKECTKGTPPPHHNRHGKRKKVSEIVRNCVPFVAELLKHSDFPHHLITNRVLYRLAQMYLE